MASVAGSVGGWVVGGSVGSLGGAVAAVVAGAVGGSVGGAVDGSVGGTVVGAAVVAVVACVAGSVIGAVVGVVVGAVVACVAGSVVGVVVGVVVGAVVACVAGSVVGAVVGVVVGAVVGCVVGSVVGAVVGFVTGSVEGAVVGDAVVVVVTSVVAAVSDSVLGAAVDSAVVGSVVPVSVVEVASVAWFWVVTVVRGMVELFVSGAGRFRKVKMTRIMVMIVFTFPFANLLRVSCQWGMGARSAAVITAVMQRKEGKCINAKTAKNTVRIHNKIFSKKLPGTFMPVAFLPGGLIRSLSVILARNLRISIRIIRRWVSCTRQTDKKNRDCLESAFGSATISKAALCKESRFGALRIMLITRDCDHSSCRSSRHSFLRTWRHPDNRCI